MLLSALSSATSWQQGFAKPAVFFPCFDSSLVHFQGRHHQQNCLPTMLWTSRFGSRNLSLNEIHWRLDLVDAFQSGWKKPLTFHLGLNFLLKIAREHESLQFNSSKSLRFSRSSVSSRGGSASMCKNSAGKHGSPWTLIGWGEHLCCTRWCCPNLGSLQKGNPPLILRVYSCLGITGSTQMLQENILGDAFLPNCCYENLPRRKHHKT